MYLLFSFLIKHNATIYFASQYIVPQKCYSNHGNALYMYIKCIQMIITGWCSRAQQTIEVSRRQLG